MMGPVECTFHVVTTGSIGGGRKRDEISDQIHALLVGYSWMMGQKGLRPMAGVSQATTVDEDEYFVSYRFMRFRVNYEQLPCGVSSGSAPMTFEVL